MLKIRGGLNPKVPNVSKRRTLLYILTGNKIAAHKPGNTKHIMKEKGNVKKNMKK